MASHPGQVKPEFPHLRSELKGCADARQDMILFLTDMHNVSPSEDAVESVSPSYGVEESE